jgi:hypothetical protein
MNGTMLNNDNGALINTKPAPTTTLDAPNSIEATETRLATHAAQRQSLQC